MTVDGDNTPYFNPKSARTPSVVVTGESPNGSFVSYNNLVQMRNPQVTYQEPVISSQQDASETITIYVGSSQEPRLNTALNARPIVGVSTNPSTIEGHFPNELDNNSSTERKTTNSTHSNRFQKLRAIKESCCSKLAKKMYFGICVTILVTASWVAATHCIKYLYLDESQYATNSMEDVDLNAFNHDIHLELATNMNEDISGILAISDTSIGPAEVEDATETFKIPKPTLKVSVFRAPFFASWFFTNFSFFYFPIYVLGRVSLTKSDKPSEILGDVMRGFRDRGFTIGRFFNYCLSFCILWLITTYLYTLSLRVLFATDAMALFATNVSCVYLLSWVILHEQFVGVRIVAVILCDTGIALLAYMDGITESPTLSGVVLATLAAAGYAVFRVMFRKIMGDPPVGQIAFAFTVLGFLNALLLWPVCLALYLTGIESLPSNHLAWVILLIASILLLVFHLLTQFSAAVTYNMFVTLGLITAVPVSGALDVILYGTTFAGMKLAGVVLIAIGFFLVMFPENWPDYITRLLRSIVLLGHNASRPAFCKRDAVVASPTEPYHHQWGRGSRRRSLAGQNPSLVDYRTGYIRSHLRSPSGRVR